MNFSGIIRSCIFALFFPPLACYAQFPQTNAPQLPDSSSPQVSARELSIPHRAIKAFNKGTELIAASKPAASIPEFRKAIKAFPNFYEAYYKIGLADLTLHNYPDADGVFSKSIELSEGRYAPASFGLGVALCFQKRYAEAEEAIHAGLDRDSKDATGHFVLAWVLFSADNMSDAEKSARQAVLYNPNLAAAYLLLAQIHLRQSDTPALAADLDAYLKLDPAGPHSVEARALRTQAEAFLAKQRGAAPALAETPPKAEAPKP